MIDIINKKKRKTEKCSICNRDISLSNIRLHIISCKNKSSSILEFKQHNNVLECPECGKLCKRLGLKSHIWQKHSNIGKIEYPFKKGKPAWNKGMTKETNIDVAKFANTLKKKYKSGDAQHPWKGRTHTSETKLRISLKLSQNNNGGRCKWFKVTNPNGNQFSVQGTWEFNFSKFLNLIDDNWIKIGIGDNQHTYKWIDVDGVIHHYTPDFWSPKLKKYFEVKGYWWGNDRQKMKLVLEQNNLNIEIVEKKAYTQYMKLVTSS